MQLKKNVLPKSYYELKVSTKHSFKTLITYIKDMDCFSLICNPYLDHRHLSLPSVSKQLIVT